jgi:hypothetical protein
VVKSRRVIQRGIVSRKRERINGYRVFVGKLEAKRVFGRTRSRGEDDFFTS